MVLLEPASRDVVLVLQGVESIPLSLDGLDGTMVRSVTAFLRTNFSDQFEMVDTAHAAVVLVDLDQPHAVEGVAKAPPGRRVIGVGFAPEPTALECDAYLQKPLTGATLLAALTEFVDRGGTGAPGDPAPDPVGVRASEMHRALRNGRAEVTPNDPNAVELQARPGPAVAASSVIRPRTVALSDRVVPTSGHATTADRLGDPLRFFDVDDRGDGDLRDPDVLVRFRYPSQDHLDGLLGRALHSNDRHWVIRGPWQEIAPAMRPGHLRVSAEPSALAAACRVPTLGSWTHHLRRHAVDTRDWHEIRADVLLWNVTVWSSNGRLPEDLDPFEPVRVRAWPDLTRYVLAPGAMAVVALTSSGWVRPVDLPEMLGIPMSHAFTTIAGLHALGLFTDDTGDPVPPSVRPAERPRAEWGLLRRFLDRLRDS